MFDKLWETLKKVVGPEVKEETAAPVIRPLQPGIKPGTKPDKAPTRRKNPLTPKPGTKPAPKGKVENKDVQAFIQAREGKVKEEASVKRSMYSKGSGRRHSEYRLRTDAKHAVDPRNKEERDASGEEALGSWDEEHKQRFIKGK